MPTRLRKRKDLNQNDELPLYNSIVEDDECVLCRSDIDEPSEFGKKKSVEDITVHHFCLLLSPNLRPNDDGDENSQIFGFAIDDIRSEVKRASKLNCFYCKESGASIGCWIRQCRKSFHLPCAIQNGCAYEFTENFRSYCHGHFDTNTLNSSIIHDSNELCAICALPMGDYNKMASLQLVCCANNMWYHKKCLRQMAFLLADDFKCPSCNNYEDFRDNMLSNGIFIPDLTYLPDSNVNEPPKPKRKRVHKDWILVQTFKTKKEAVEMIAAEKCWSYYYDNTSSLGHRINYRCNFVKFGGKQCAAAMYMLYDSTSTDIHLYRADAVHTHENLQENAAGRLSDEVEAEIRILFERGRKPKGILYDLVVKGLTPPSKSKLTTFLAKLRKEKFGSQKLHYGSLQKWLNENSELPISDDQPFVVDHIVNVNDDDIEKSFFRFFVSTKRLLQNAIGVKKVHTDGTYKLIWQGFPILLFGTTDNNRKFHPFGACVTTNECREDFEFMFLAAKDILRRLFNEELKPEVLISDAAGAIHNGFTAVFPYCTNIDDIIMCWSHMRRAVVKKLPVFLKSVKLQNEFLSDVDQLQLARSKNAFNEASKLLLAKWKVYSQPLVDYIEKEWLQHNVNWYEGFRSKCPSTNNALESFNKTIKDEHTLRERLDLSQFRVVFFNMIEQWSTEYKKSLNSINRGLPQMELKHWTDGYNFARSNIKITSVRHGNKITYTVPISPVDDLIRTHRDFIGWNSFNEYKLYAFAFAHTTFEYPVTADNWLSGECDCANGFKLFFCEHMTGIALRLNATTAPVEAKTIPIGQKRKRGRPAKAKKALVYQ